MASQATAASASPQLADADRLPLAGKWRITIRSVELGGSPARHNTQYGRFVRISPTGDIFEWERHELNGGASAVWKEAATATGRIEQLDAQRFRVQMPPNEPHEYHLRSRDKSSFVLGRRWEIVDDPKERARRPYPRPPRGDRHFENTLTFEPGTAPGTRP